MARGRKAQPDAIKALKGNPGKRALLMQGRDETPERIATPEFLTGADEKRVFKLIAEELVTRNFIRKTDAIGLARWASYVARWASAKKALGRKQLYYTTESKHGSLLRIHPLFQTMVAMERLMISLEDRLGLNPAARQTIIRGLMLQPPPPPPADGLFGEPKPGDAQPDAAAPAPAPADTGPLGYLKALNTLPS